LSIKIHYDKIKFRIRRTGELRRFLEKVIGDEELLPGDLNFIFTNDASIIQINREFLGHDYFTDVITFNNSEGSILNGEIYLSVDTIKRNAQEYKVKLYQEIARVMIHGVLHLCGYNDDSERSRKVMLKRQEELLKEFLKKV